MLNAELVVRLLVHEDDQVRHRAAEYLRDCPSPPENSSDVFWEAFDRYRIQDSSVSFAYSYIPQTESSCRRLVAVVADKGTTSNDVFHLRFALERLPIAFLEAHRDEVLAAAHSMRPMEPLPWKKGTARLSSADHLAERLALRNVPPQQLWTDIEKLAMRLDRLARNRWDWRQDYRLREALARHPEFVIERCVPLLGKDQTWLGVFAIELLCMVRHQPELDLLVPRLEDSLSCDYEAATKLLAQIGGQQVLNRLLHEFAARKGKFRCHLLRVISAMHTADAERALIELIRSGELAEDEVNTAAQELVDLFTTDGIELLCDLVRAGRYDPGLSDLREDVLILGKAVGVAIPEQEAWQQQTEADHAARRAMSPLQRMGSLLRGPSTAEQATPPLAAACPMPRSAEVGRNDPCPCGSGKKYKKCCLNK